MVLSIKIVTEYPLWFSIFCIILGGGYAGALYFKENRFDETSKWVKKLLTGLRVVLVTILAFLLLSPFVKTLFNKVEKPVIIIAQDNTSSLLLNKDSAFYKTKYKEQLQQLQLDLEEEYEVKFYTFGKDLSESNQIDYSRKVTDLSIVFEELNNKFYNRNVGALILASDGIFNRGTNPVFSTDTEYPIYTIAMGDTALQKDLVLKEVIHNKITFLGNQFPLEISADAYHCEGRTTKLEVTHQGKVLFSKEYKFEQKQQSINENVLFDAEKVGVQHYRISLSTIEGEISYINNIKDVYIEVLDGRQNILVLANSPHPDVKALKLSIEKNENYKVTTSITSDFDGNTEPYSLIIAHQLSSANQGKLEKLVNGKISILYIFGNQTSLNLLNYLKLGISISNSRNKFNEVLPVADSNFPLFTLSESTLKFFNSVPPVVAPFGQYKLNKQAYTLAYQKIGSVATETPLISFFQDENKKSGIITGEGIWKWRMYDFQENGSTENFDELINKMVQFLSVKEDKSKFRVIAKNEFYENDEILLNAELYNESYELVNEPELTIQIVGEDDSKYDFTFGKTSNSYMLNVGMLPVGFYNYYSNVKFGDKSYTETGKINIKPLLLEANNTVANHQLLKNISEKFSGKMFLPNQLGLVKDEVLKNADITSVIYEENDIKEIINLKWIFFVLITLLGLEWFLRKRNGAY